jgi:hypothetical protein
MAAAANAPSPPPVADDALSWRPRPAPSRPVVDNDLIDIYRETFNATRTSRGLRCRDCGEPMTPGGSRTGSTSSTRDVAPGI